MRDLVSKAVVSPLSKREREVIRLLAQGLTVTEIAQRICRSVKTVSCHKANAMRKLASSLNATLSAISGRWVWTSAMFDCLHGTPPTARQQETSEKNRRGEKK